MRPTTVATTCLAIISVTTIRASVLPSRRTSVCNGYIELCNRSYGNITYLGAHDSFAYSWDIFALARDQEVDIPTQLNLGVRLLQAQAHDNKGVLHFCHTSCALFDGGTVQHYLSIVKSWLDSNPSEVVTLIFTNPDGLSLPDQWAPAFDNSGISSYAYIPASLPVSQSDWPTLGELIEMGKRLIVFMDYGANGSDGGVVDYIMPEFDMIWETPFSGTNSSFPCSVNRISGPLLQTQHMYMINHSLNVNIFSLIIPDRVQASTTNSVTSILANANGCAPFAGGRAPNFVLLDWVNVGHGMQAVNQLNGLA